jgi:hypothetical protein
VIYELILINNSRSFPGKGAEPSHFLYKTKHSIGLVAWWGSHKGKIDWKLSRQNLWLVVVSRITKKLAKKKTETRETNNKNHEKHTEDEELKFLIPIIETSKQSSRCLFAIDSKNKCPNKNRGKSFFTGIISCHC